MMATMDERTAVGLARLSAGEALDKADPVLFPGPPEGHFWLENLIRVLADQGERRETSMWRIFGARGDCGAFPALYAVNRQTGYGMLHGSDPDPTARLLEWALRSEPHHKVLAPYLVLERAIDAMGSGWVVRRDHRELFLTLGLGHLAVEPDWDYRLATHLDIPRLWEYNRIYNEERRTNWSRDWHTALRNRVVYVREREGTISSCLLRGALIAPWVSFGGVFTFPEFRGRGDATMLVANFCAEMFLSGLNVCLIVDDDNAPAVRAYTKAGFVPAGLYRTTYFASRRAGPDRA